MSRRSLINELVANGYEAGALNGLNTSELCVLVQEEVTGNVWSDAARARAAAVRARLHSTTLHGHLTRAGFKEHAPGVYKKGDKTITMEHKLNGQTKWSNSHGGKGHSTASLIDHLKRQ